MSVSLWAASLESQEVSGSGKSSLVGETLVPALARELGQAAGRVGPYKSLRGVEHVDKLIEITQEPIGPNAAKHSRDLLRRL